MKTEIHFFLHVWANKTITLYIYSSCGKKYRPLKISWFLQRGYIYVGKLKWKNDFKHYDLIKRITQIAYKIKEIFMGKNIIFDKTNLLPLRPFNNGFFANVLKVQL